MDHIINQLRRRITYHETAGNPTQLQAYYRALIEYSLVFTLGMLWNQRFTSVPPDRRDKLLHAIQKPTIGVILGMCQSLDIDDEFFGSRALKRAFNAYPTLRNDSIGHGLIFEDYDAALAAELKKLADLLFSEGSPFTVIEYDLVLVLDHRNQSYRGVLFKSNGVDFAPWNCPDSVGHFLVGHVYARSREMPGYAQISPFVYITPDHQFFVFKELKDRLLGRVRYNQLLQTGNTNQDWDLSDWEIFNDGSRRKTANGTVINTFTPNYKKYIHVGIKDQIENFLKKNRASVCATVWGHGGVGKTATIQALCADLAASEKKIFDYIVFVSAKDRYYDYYTGSITVISDRVDSLEGILRKASAVIGHADNVDIEQIRSVGGRLLLVIDDYETFPEQEKIRIESFVRTLDINKHKVVLTTRANLIVGDEIPTAELDQKQTADFLLEALRTEVPAYNFERAAEELRQKGRVEQVHLITSGRPLFIYQFAIIWGQEGSLDGALRSDIKDAPAAIDFLYGRIFDYLSDDAKRLFWIAGQLVTGDDLANLLEKLKYVSNLEDSESRFGAAVQELKKLRIIEVSENDFFRVYSPEILRIMRAYFDDAPPVLKSGVIGRIKQVTRDKKLDNERALLENANSARYARSEEEVISLYRQILHRTTSPPEVKVQALLNLTDWLFNARGKKERAVRTFRDFDHLLGDEPSIVRMFASYCWAIGEKEDAVRILSEFFRGAKKKLDANTHFEIAGLLLTYEGVAAIEFKDDAKTKLQSGIIELKDFYALNDESKRRFAKLKNFGLNEIRKLKDDDMQRLRGAARQNMLTGIYQLANVCIRLGHLQDAAYVCEFGVRNSPDYLHKEFKDKAAYVNAQQATVC